ncbi:unnamed protein product [Rotaria sordida]|uniref:Uncharacterized protein n=1 Tax=Rotaria sordida TaxID=392033 RepID=A0A814DCL2_9BILA|nr:unnamed protein product [Rotaria sordida]CAF3768172.1 unnamed protein product [Rotaria sordida]
MINSGITLINVYSMLDSRLNVNIYSQDDNNETLKIEKRNDMLEQLLSLLLISHHLGGTSLPLQKKSPFLKGIFPGSRLGLHGIHPNSSTKTNTHYCRGDLGIVPHDNYIENTHSN